MTKMITDLINPRKDIVQSDGLGSDLIGDQGYLRQGGQRRPQVKGQAPLP